MDRTEIHEFIDDMLAYIEFIKENYDDEYHQELKIKGTLIHDICGILREDEHFLPRVSGYSKRILIKTK